MYSPPKVIVVDDKPNHLEAIVGHFREKGSPALGIHFTGNDALRPEFFIGVRYLFMDLHLLAGGSSSDNKQHYAAITNILESSISSTGGPFVLIIWTENAQLGNDLTAYLDERIDEKKSHARPLAILTIDKADVIDATNGKAKTDTSVSEAVSKALELNPQLLALLEWEKNVSEASAATLSALLNLVPPEKRNSKDYGGALDNVLSQIAEDALGKANAKDRPGAAITAALAPILSDRLIAKTSYHPNGNVWKHAVSSLITDQKREVSAISAGQVNRMLHFAVHDGEEIGPQDLGAVVELPEPWQNPEGFLETFAVSLKDVFVNEFKIAEESHGSCEPVLVHIGAPCDFAQRKPGPRTFLFGVRIPLSAKCIKGSKPTDACWVSPHMTLGQDTFRLGVNFRFPANARPTMLAHWKAKFRIREQLLMDLLSRHASYISRPGFVSSWPPK